MNNTNILDYSPKVNSKGLLSMKADHILISVSNFDETVLWYKRVLGFEIEFQWKVEGMDHLDLAYLNNGNFRLEIIGNQLAKNNVPSVHDLEEHLSDQGFAHLCFQVDDIDYALVELSELGVESFVSAKTYPLATYRRRVAFVKDPSGNVIELAGPLF